MVCLEKPHFARLIAKKMAWGGLLLLSGITVDLACGCGGFLRSFSVPVCDGCCCGFVLD